MASKTPIQQHFPTSIYVESKSGVSQALLKQILKESYQIRDMDTPGQHWSAENYSNGYTSYGSMAELHMLSSSFARLGQIIDRHVRLFSKHLCFDWKNYPLELRTMWVSIMPSGVTHSMHLHPLSTLSGTIYISVPNGSGLIKFEDPRLNSFMASPPRLNSNTPASKSIVKIKPLPGQVVLFESWLRHEVETNRSQQDRVSVSFNYHY